MPARQTSNRYTFFNRIYYQRLFSNINLQRMAVLATRVIVLYVRNERNEENMLTRIFFDIEWTKKPKIVFTNWRGIRGFSKKKVNLASLLLLLPPLLSPHWPKFCFSNHPKKANQTFFTDIFEARMSWKKKSQSFVIESNALGTFRNLFSVSSLW